MASIWGRENAVAMIKKRVQYTKGFTKRTLISAALTSLATLANATATTQMAGNCHLNYVKSIKQTKVYGCILFCSYPDIQGAITRKRS